MKTKSGSVLVALLLSVVVLSSVSAQSAVEYQLAMEGSQDQLANGLLFMYEEEKLARDVYLALFDTWKIRTFQNIANSEQQHMDAIASVLEQRGIANPALNGQRGVFLNQEISNLYTQLVAQGKSSPSEALLIGATIEDLDIRDLEAYLLETSEADVTGVYMHLLKGSENHMVAFTSQLRRYGMTYSAQYITQDRLQSIIAR